MGALLGYLLLVTLLPQTAYAVVFGLVAGIMLHIAVTELLPAARRLASTGAVAASCMAGAATIAASLAMV